MPVLIKKKVKPKYIPIYDPTLYKNYYLVVLPKKFKEKI